MVYECVRMCSDCSKEYYGQDKEADLVRVLAARVFELENTEHAQGTQDMSGIVIG